MDGQPGLNVPNSRDTAATLIAWGDEFSRQHEDTDRTEKEFLDEIYRCV